MLSKKLSCIVVAACLQGAVAAEPSINLQADVVYKTTAEGDLCLDLYYPETELSGKYPLVVYTHGGGWAAADRKKATRGGPGRVVRSLTKAGFCVAAVDYRLCKKETDTRIRDCVTDCMDAVRLKSVPLRLP